MTPTFTPSPPGSEKATRQGGSLKDGINVGSLSLQIQSSISPRAIVAQHAAHLKGLSLPVFVRVRLLAAIIKGDALALAVEMLAEGKGDQ